MNSVILSPEALSKVAVDRRGYQVIQIEDRESWLKLRRADVTASVAGCLLGVHDYTTPLALWVEKAGAASALLGETAAQRRGRLLEPVALQLLAEERPSWSVFRCATYYRDPARRIGATPDAMAIDPTRPGFGIVQIKTAEPSIFRRKWRNDDGDVEPPLWIAVQAIVEAELTGASWAAVVPVRVGFGVELDVIDIPLHAGVMDRVRTKVAEFWTLVEAGRRPDPDYARDGELLAALYNQDDGTTIDLTGNNSIIGLADEDATLADEIKLRKDRREAIKAEVLATLGEHAIATVDGRVVATAKTVHRKEYLAKATSYRDVRLRRSAVP